MAGTTKFSVVAELRARTEQLEARVNEAFSRIEKRGSKTADRVRERLAKGMSKAADRAITAGAAGVTAIIGTGLKDAVEFGKILDDIGIQAAGSAAELDAFRAALEETSAKTGISRTNLANAGKTLVDLLGPIGMNAQLLDLLARTSIASGAPVEDLAGLISSMADNAGIAADDIEGMEAALSAFLSTGKSGKVPLEQMNGVLQEVMANWKEMGSTGARAAADVSAALQVARRAFGSASQAGTGLKSGVTALKQHGDKIDAEVRRLARNDRGLAHLRGFTVWADKSKESLKDFRELAPVLAQLNLEQLTDVLGSAEAAKFWAAFKDADLEQLTAELGDAEEAMKRFKDTGFQAFLGMADAAVQAGDVSEDFAKRQETQSFKLQKAWNDAKLAIAQAMTPERVDMFVQAMEKLAKVLGFVVDHLGAFIALLAAGKLAQFAMGLAGIAKELRSVAEGTKSASSAATAASGASKVAGGVAAFGGGLSAGQLIGHGIVGAREKRFAAGKARQQQALGESERAAAATEQLIDAGLIDTSGQLDPAFLRNLRTAQLLGEDLSELQQAAVTALAGFEVAEAASGSLSEGLIRQLRGPERRQLVQGNEFGALIGAVMQLNATVQAQQQATRDNTAAQRGKPNGSQGRPTAPALDTGRRK